MKKTTIKWRMFKYNLIIIITLVILISVTFNIIIRLYMQRDILSQLNSIAENVESTILKQSPDFFSDNNVTKREVKNTNPRFRLFVLLSPLLRQSVSILNANYILLDNDANITYNSMEEIDFTDGLINEIRQYIKNDEIISEHDKMSYSISNTDFVAIVKPLPKNKFKNLQWIVIYSSVEKINQLQLMINGILVAILIFSSAIAIIFSSILSKKISTPLSSLNKYIRNISVRNFDSKINIDIDDEFKELINNINIMTEKLKIHDKAQKNFLQNASHEFRTPLMSIQSYAEGIQYDVVEKNQAAKIIIEESKRLTALVEDLLYLSRLDAVEESYNYKEVEFNQFINKCIERINGVAIKNNIKLDLNMHEQIVYNVVIDEEKMSRAIVNILNNSIRYAQSVVKITVSKVEDKNIKIQIIDDGPGINLAELPYIFDRFYKGKKGKYGLGLAISKSIIEKHNGRINAKNSEDLSGAQFDILLPV